jgi:hypothetical protein
MNRVTITDVQTMKTERDNNRGISRKGGRPTKADPATFRYTIYMNAKRHAEFMRRYRQSGLRAKAHFISACIFERELKVVRVDKAAMDYYMRLTTIHAQIRKIGVNYNQITVAVKGAFEGKKAFALLRKLEESTRQLITLHGEIKALITESEAEYLLK